MVLENAVWGDRYRVSAESGEIPREIEQRARAQIKPTLVSYLVKRSKSNKGLHGRG